MIKEQPPFTIQKAFCTYCDQENGTYKKIWDILKEEYPIESEMFPNKSSVSFLERKKQLSNIFYTLTECFIISFDDIYEAICKKHLQEIIDKM